MNTAAKCDLFLLTTFLLVCLMTPQFALAGGDAGKSPYEIGEKYFARKDYKTALKHYRKALERGDVRAQYRLGFIYEKTGRDRGLLERGKSLFKKGKYREAEKVLLQAAAKEKSKPEIHFYLGEVYMALEAYGKAESEYKKAKVNY